MNRLTAATCFNPLRHLRLPLFALSAGLLLAGCAGDPPTEQMAVSRTLVEGAVSAGGTEHAAVEMRNARDKLQKAEMAMQDHDYKRARMLAEQAEWDARVAERKAQAEKAESALKDAREGVQDLREEGMRDIQR